MSVAFVFLNLIVYAVAGMLLCLWVDGIAESATDRYIGSSALRSALVWLAWPATLPVLLYLSSRIRRQGEERLAEADPRRRLAGMLQEG